MWGHRFFSALFALFGLVFVVGAGAASSASAAPMSSVALVGEFDSAGTTVVPAADVNDFSFDSVHVDYELSRDSTGKSHLLVTETFVANFTNPDTHRGMQRILPTVYNGAPLNVTLISITDENGKDREQEVSTSGESYTMTSRASDPVIGTQTYVFTYTMDNVTREYQDTQADEFYWDVIGAEFRQPFYSATMTLRMDKSLAANLKGDMSCYYGGTGATDSCSISQSGDQILAGPVTLQPFQGITVAVGFKQGTFKPFDRSWTASPGFPVQAGLLGLAAAGIAGTAVVRRTKLADAKGTGIIIPQYEPPPGVDAMTAAALLGETRTGIPAEILEQAIRGSIYLQESPRKRNRFEIVLVDPNLAGDPNGQQTLAALFGHTGRPGETVDLKRDTDASSRLISVMNRQKRAIHDSGLRRTAPLWVRTVLPLATIAAAAGAFIVGREIGKSYYNPAGGVIGVVVILIAASTILLTSKKPYTAQGTQIREHLDGLKMFMAWAEEDRLRMLQSPEGAERVRVDTQNPREMLRLYEPLLPYAVAFGMMDSWANTLRIYYNGVGVEPRWYAGSSQFDSSSMNRLVASSTPVVPSSSGGGGTSSSSSSSGGSSGGGSVGGGGGGGGGGGV